MSNEITVSGPVTLSGDVTLTGDLNLPGLKEFFDPASTMEVTAISAPYKNGNTVGYFYQVTVANRSQFKRKISVRIAGEKKGISYYDETSAVFEAGESKTFEMDIYTYEPERVGFYQLFGEVPTLVINRANNPVEVQTPWTTSPF